MSERLLAIDVGRKTGFAFGDTSRPAREVLSGAVTLLKPGESAPRGAGRMSRWLLGRIREWKPTMVAVEDWMSPAAMDSVDVVENSLLMHGAILGLVSIYDIPTWHVNVLTWRKHLCGMANATPPKKVNPITGKREKRTSREKEEARLANKKMVFERAKILGFLPANLQAQYDQADACGVFQFAADNYCRRDAVAPLVLFGEGK